MLYHYNIALLKQHQVGCNFVTNMNKEKKCWNKEFMLLLLFYHVNLHFLNSLTYYTLFKGNIRIGTLDNPYSIQTKLSRSMYLYGGLIEIPSKSRSARKVPLEFEVDTAWNNSYRMLRHIIRDERLGAVLYRWQG